MQKSTGIIIACKPIGMSSFKVVSYAKRTLGIKKIGHLGTLDPLACGVLVLLVGREATKLNQQLSVGTKVYRSVFTFGIKTATADSEGEIIERSNKIPTMQEIQKALFSGKIDQAVPKFSAVHINGQRAYDLARHGIDFTPPTKQVEIFRFECLKQISTEKFLFEIECSTGTYIRALAEMLAEKLGTVAFASTILRTRVGRFDIKNAIFFKQINANCLISPQDEVE